MVEASRGNDAGFVVFMASGKGVSSSGVVSIGDEVGEVTHGYFFLANSLVVRKTSFGSVAAFAVMLDG